MGEMPKALIERPTLLPGLGFFYDAYLDLLSDRPVGMGIGPIPWSSIALFARVHEMDADDLQELLHLIRAMEHADQEHQQKKEAK